MQRIVVDEQLVWLTGQATDSYWDAHWSQSIDFALGNASVPYFIESVLKELPACGKILEAGCGNGSIVKALMDRGFDVTGVDYAEKTVDHLKARGLPIQVMDVRNLLHPEGFFDFYLSFGVIEHFFNEADCQRAIDEALRVTKRNGYLFFSVPFTNYFRRQIIRKSEWRSMSSFPQESFYQRSFSLEHLTELFKGREVAIKKIIYYGAAKGLADEVECLRLLKKRPWSMPISCLEHCTPIVNQFCHMVGIVLKKSSSHD